MGSNTAQNLTPRMKDIDGLSYSLTMPISGTFTITSIETINATGKLIAIQDRPNHVSVVPIDLTRMQEWMESRENANMNPHEYTQILQAISIRIKL